MIKRVRHNGNINNYRILPIKQIYARIYIKSIKKIIIVSKDGTKWQMPGGKPEKGESIFETLHREIYEETSINLTKNCNPIPFGYYFVEEDGIEYLQLRYFIELDNIEVNLLKPNEIESSDSIKFIKLVTTSEVQSIIPRLQNSGEFNSFNKIIRNT